MDSNFDGDINSVSDSVIDNNSNIGDDFINPIADIYSPFLAKFLESGIYKNFINALVVYASNQLLELAREDNKLIKNRVRKSLIPLENDAILKSIAVESINPLVEVIREVITDFVLDFFYQKIFKDNYIPLGSVSQIFGIDRSILDSWIRNKFIKSYRVNNIRVVSCQDVRKCLLGVSDALKHPEVNHIEKLMEFIKTKSSTRYSLGDPLNDPDIVDDNNSLSDVE